MNFRPVYRELTQEEQALLLKVKQAAATVGNYLDEAKASREISLAKTKLEEAVMWAVKGITTPPTAH
jgi:predicted transcriptional regulator